MAQPTTAKFGKFQVMLGTTQGPPSTVTPTSISNANPAVVVVPSGDIAAFKNGMAIEVAGATGDAVAANGTQIVANLNAGANSFELEGVDLSGAAAPVTTGVTITAPGSWVYAAPCGFSSKSFTLTKNLQEIDIPDCDDPDAVAWIGRDAQNLSAVIAGNGVAAAESVPTWNDAWNSTESIPALVEIEFSTGTLTYEGMFQVDSLAFTAEQAGRVQLAVNMQSDGAVTNAWIPTP